MGAGTVSCPRGAGCTGCAERDAVIARLEAERDAAVCTAALERRGRKDAEARLQAVTDRLEFVEPMYAVVHRDNEGLRAANADMRARLRGEESGRAVAEEERDMYRGAAADAQFLRDRLAAETAARINAENDYRMLIGQLRIDPRTGRVSYRKGPNTPPSARKKAAEVRAAVGGQGAADADAAAAAAAAAAGAGRPGGGSGRRTVPGRPGGRPGHKGHGRSYKPTRTVNHNLPRRDDGTLALQKCRCGKGHWVIVDREGRPILELRMLIECVNHVREVAKCTGCGALRPAVDGLPANGTWDHSMCGFATALRANKMVDEDIARMLTDIAPKAIKVSKTNVIDSLGRVCDALRPYSEAIVSKIRGGAVAYEDETTSPAVPTRQTAERAERLAVAGSISSALIASIPQVGMPAVLAVDPSASSWSASAALAAGEALEMEGHGAGPGAPPLGAAGPGPPASALLAGLAPAEAEGLAPAEAAPAAAPGPEGGPGPRPPSSIFFESAAALLSAAAASVDAAQEGVVWEGANADGMPWLPAAADAAARWWQSLNDDAAAAAAGLSAASLIDAAARTAAGIGPEEDLVGVAAEECLRDGSANGAGWAWVFTNGNLVAYRFGLTRGGIMHDKYMLGFAGILVADRYAIYRSRFEADGRLQLCWAHELRDIGEDAMRPGSSPAIRQLYRDVRGVFRAARDAVADVDVPRTGALRLMHEQCLDDVIDRYRGCGEEDAERIVDMLDRDKRSLFTFLEHEGVEPTNNRAERALRYIVLLRKVFGQIKGGRRSMERLGHLATCVRTWRAQGKSIMEEVARIM